MVVKVGDVFFLLLCVCIFRAYHEHACLDEHVCCCLYISDVQQLRPFSVPFKSIFLILHVTPLSCGLLNAVLDAVVSYFSAKFGLCYALCLKIIELDVERRDVPYLSNV